MPSKRKHDRVFNFCAGPSTLPVPVLKQVQSEMLAYQDEGASILEISHRSPAYAAVQAEAETHLRALLGVPDGYHILFLPGGASLQFGMVPMNFLGGDRFADYIVTGTWTKKAVADARKVGSARVVWDGAGSGYTHVPDVGAYKVDPEASYAWFAYNETIHGVEFQSEPEVGDVPLICDASSTLLSRPIPIEKYSLIFAGAQKNLGPAGATVVIIKDSFLERIDGGGLPRMLDYTAHVKANSTLNTPPVFAVYMLALTTRWLRETYGVLSAVHTHNRQKAALVYDALDRSEGYYRPHAAQGSRSLMNITWRLPSEGLERLFLAEAAERGLVSLKGHRSVGGIRASLYNAMPTEGALALASFMDDFRKANG